MGKDFITYHDRPPSPGRLRYIALVSAELGYPEPDVANDAEAGRVLQELLAEKRKRQALKQSGLAKALYNTLIWNSKAMNYLAITDIIKQEYPQLHANTTAVLILLRGRKDLFQKYAEGTYFLAGKVEGRSYPLI